jgi:hypothetical protein
MTGYALILFGLPAVVVSSMYLSDQWQAITVVVFFTTVAAVVWVNLSLFRCMDARSKIEAAAGYSTVRNLNLPLVDDRTGALARNAGIAPALLEPVPRRSPYVGLRKPKLSDEELGPDTRPRTPVRTVFVLGMFVVVILCMLALVIVLLDAPIPLSYRAIALPFAVGFGAFLGFALATVPKRAATLKWLAQQFPEAVVFLAGSGNGFSQGLVALGQGGVIVPRWSLPVVADRNGIRIFRRKDLVQIASIPWGSVTRFGLGEQGNGGRGIAHTIVVVATQEERDAVLIFVSPHGGGAPLNAARSEVEWFARQLQAFWRAAQQTPTSA